MNAIELADMLVSKEVLLVNDQVCEAASLLRRQHSDLASAHEAIVKLREALRNIQRRSSLDSYINEVAKQALKDTEDLK